MRLIATWLTIVVLALMVGVSTSVADSNEERPAANKPAADKAAVEKRAANNRLDATSRHILELRDKDPKVRARAAKELGCS